MKNEMNGTNNRSQSFDDSEQRPSARLGLFLKQKRIERGFTQSEVAKKLGYGSPQFISNIERGISNAPLKSLRVIIDMYELSGREVLEILIEEKRKHYEEQLGLHGQEKSPSLSSHRSTAVQGVS